MAKELCYCGRSVGKLGPCRVCGVCVFCVLFAALCSGTKAGKGGIKSKSKGRRGGGMNINLGVVNPASYLELEAGVRLLTVWHCACGTGSFLFSVADQKVGSHPIPIGFGII